MKIPKYIRKVNEVDYMEIIKIIIFEFLLGYGLQGFVAVLGIYVFNKQKIVLKKFFIAGILFTIISYFVRLLPISFGVHTILNILFMFLISIIILKIPAYPTIRSVFLIFVLLIFSEMLDIAFLIFIVGKEKYESMLLDPTERAITALPANIMFALLITSAYFILNNTKKKKGDTYGNISP